MSPFAHAMTAHLAARASGYFPELAGASSEVRLRWAAERELSSVYRFDLIAGERRRPVIVKRCGRGAKDGPPPDDRPRIGAWTRPDLLWRFEQATLTAIREHFGELGDSRFGAVRLLDVLPDDRAIVMECLEHPTLRALAVHRGWLHRSTPPDRVVAAFEHAGAWLRAYQTIRPMEHTLPRFATRGEVVGAIAELAGYLEAHTGDGRFIRRFAPAAQTAARSLLPDVLPAGLGHGDFAPRNVLVGPAERVFVIDTVGKWRWPVHLDLAYFLTALETLGPQLGSGGLYFSRKTLETFERAFLRGYFTDESPPLATIRLFEIQCLLARWSSAAHRAARSSGASGLVRKTDLALRGRFYRRCLERALRDLPSVERSAASLHARGGATRSQ